MEEVRGFCRENPVLTTVMGSLVVATAGMAVYWWLTKDSQTNAGGGGADYPKNTVILHQIGRGPYAPSMTPFAVKLETYLRMAKIPYKNVHDNKRSSKGKFPWMEYNGVSIADSAFCIAHLNKARRIDLNERLAPTQRGVAVAFQRLVEDSLYWALIIQRWCDEPDVNFTKISLKAKFPAFFIRYFIKPTVKKWSWYQGMGRHTRDEVLEIARKDLTALSDYIGQKLFLMGDVPSEMDCAVFGMLSQIYWHCPTQTLGKIFKEEYPILVAYCDRMKTKFWPDWDDCITHGGTRRATK